MKKQIAIITGIEGQDGSYLAKLLIDQGIEVIGTDRRSGRSDHWRHKKLGIDGKFKIEYMDITEYHNVCEVIEKYKPDYFFNLAAQSFVQTSFTQPFITSKTNAEGVLNILEAIRRYSPHTRMYQASTSEMFGRVKETPQNENTPFNPVSPYGVAKLYSHEMVKVYRESYGLYCCSGILFNHETMASFLPVFVKNKNSNIFDIKPIEEIYEFNKNKLEYQEHSIQDIQVWGKDSWVDVSYASAYPHDKIKDNKKPRIINGRCGAYMATGSHVAFLQNKEEKTENIKIGDHFEIITLPENKDSMFDTTLEEAELIGMLVADGYISYSKFSIQGKFTKNDKILQQRFRDLWKIVTEDTQELRSQEIESGFKKGNFVTQILFSSKSSNIIKYQIYNKDKTKRIPIQILNASKEIQLAFLKGYNKCDGLKKGYGNYEFKSFKTNSATLAQGLWYLTDRLLPNQRKTLNIEFKKELKRIYYVINFGSELNYDLKQNKLKILELRNQGMSQREIHRQTGINRGFIRRVSNNEDYEIKRHLEKPFNEIKKIIDYYNYDGWFYDITTSSSEFCCGIGNIHVHNSPLRGEEFVTRKITKGISDVLHGRQECIYLGNLNAKRDWGFAGDYVKGMWLMLNQKVPRDYVLATGETHTIRDFIRACLEYLELPYTIENPGTENEEIWVEECEKPIIKINKEFYRPNEVDLLLGDPAKAETELGWKRDYNFKDLVASMMKSDMEINK